MILIDHESIYKIVYHSILNTISMDGANCYLINISVYLFAYQLDIYYILGCLNFVPDTFSHLCILGDDVICENNVEFILNAL